MDTKKLRQKILDLAIRGKLVPQDPNDEPASVLLERIRAEKQQLIKEGKIKAPKGSKACDTSHYEKIEGPFEIPESWEWCRVADIANSILYGVSESAKPKGRYKLLRITDIQGNKVDWNSVPFTNYDEEDAQKYLLNDGDILFARTGATVGKSYLVADITHDSIYASYLIRIQTSKIVSPEYVKRFFESGYYWEQISSSSVGVGQPNVNGTSLANLLIPIPPFDEQKRIVLESEKWFSLIESIDKESDCLSLNIERAKSLFLKLAISGKLVPQDPTDEPAIELLKRINPDFKACDNSHYENLPEGWTIATVADVFEINPKVQASDDIDAGFVPMANICDGFNNAFSFETKKWAKIKNGFSRFADGDIAVAKISPCLENRKSVILHGLPNGIGAGTTELNIFRSPVVVPEYGLIFFKSDEFIKKCAGSYNGVVGQQRVSRYLIEEMQFPIPPIEEQRRIVKKTAELMTTLSSLTEDLL